MLGQLGSVKDDLLVDVRYPLQKEATMATLRDARAKPEKLLYAPDRKRDPMSFRLTISRDLGMKRGKTAGSFVLESKQQTSELYRSILQGLRAWAPAAPSFRRPSNRSLPSRPPNLRPSQVEIETSETRSSLVPSAGRWRHV